jgi:hypothetical protein
MAPETANCVFGRDLRRKGSVAAVARIIFASRNFVRHVGGLATATSLLDRSEHRHRIIYYQRHLDFKIHCSSRRRGKMLGIVMTPLRPLFEDEAAHD